MSEEITKARKSAEAFAEAIVDLAKEHLCRIHVHRSKLGEIRVMLEAPGVNTTFQFWGFVHSKMTDEEREEHLDRISEILREGMMPLPKFGPEQPFFAESASP